MADIEKNYRSLAQRLGPPVEYAAMPEDDLAYCAGRLPPRLIQFLRDNGHATFQNGGVTIARPLTIAPILALIFKDDPDLSHQDCTTVSYNPFGHLSLWSQTLGFVEVYLAEGQITSQQLAPTEFSASPLRPQPVTPPDPNLVARGAILSYEDQFDFLDYRGEAMLARCIAAHGPIALGECYGFFPTLALIGTQSPMRRVENIRRVPALEHFAVLAQAQPFHLTKVGPSGIEEVREIGCPLP